LLKKFAELNFTGRDRRQVSMLGKSTQIYYHKRWLEAEGERVYFSEWNSSESSKSATAKGKKARTDSRPRDVS